MVEFQITKMSSKGQVVIPVGLRKFLMISKRVENAWKEIEQGKFKKMSSEDFLTEIRNIE